MKNIFSILGLFCLALTLNACATLFGSSTDDIQFDTEPEGATVEINGQYYGKTPVKLTLPRRTESTTAVFKLEGHSPKSVFLDRSIASAVWFNVVFLTTTTGAPSVGTDAVTNHLLAFDPRAYVIKLDRVNATSASRPDGLEFAVLNHDNLRMELARGKGEYFESFCGFYSLSAKRCARYFEQARARNATLSATTNSLEWYRAIRPLAEVVPAD